MTVVWVLLGMGTALSIACIGYLGWRDQHRSSSADDRSASRAAASDAERHAAMRHAVQGVTRHNEGRNGRFS